MRARRWKRVRLRAVKQTVDIKDEAPINQRAVNEEARRQRCRKSSGWSSKKKKRRGLMFATFIYNGRGPHLALTATAAHTGWPHTCTDNCAQLDVSFIPPPPHLPSVVFCSSQERAGCGLVPRHNCGFPLLGIKKSVTLKKKIKDTRPSYLCSFFLNSVCQDHFCPVGIWIEGKRTPPRLRSDFPRRSHYQPVH